MKFIDLKPERQTWARKSLLCKFIRAGVDLKDVNRKFNALKSIPYKDKFKFTIVFRDIESSVLVNHQDFNL